MESTRSRLDAEITVFDAIRAILRHTRVTSRAIERDVGLSLAQLYVLEQLAMRPAESLSELAERTATHQSSVSVVVRRLVDRGFVGRRPSPRDARVVAFEITDAGRALLLRAPRSAQTELLEALRVLSPDQVEQLSVLLSEWLRAARIDAVEPPMLGSEAAAG